jgi:hypothetical protein
MDEPLPRDWASRMEVNESLYALYRENYIKTPDSPDKPCLQILMEFLREYRTELPPRVN